MSHNSTYIIAEAGVNHNGCMERAKALIHAAAEAGVDTVKFQTFSADHLVTKNAAKADYQQQQTGSDENQYEMLKKLELSHEQHHMLKAECDVAGITFFSTSFDDPSLTFLAEDMNLPFFKIPSGEITNAPSILRHARYGRPIILSTGMSTLKDIEEALGVIAFGYMGNRTTPSRAEFHAAYTSDQGKALLKERVTLLHCTSEYPAPVDSINLKAMDTMRDTFGLKVGYSDHSMGITVPIAAVARGASIIEKHFTLDRSLPGPDHKASLEPYELKAMTLAIREIELALGNDIKAPQAGEANTASVARKSLHAATSISKGQVITSDNLAIMRPASGISPIDYWDIIGKKSSKDYIQGESMIVKDFNNDQ